MQIIDQVRHAVEVGALKAGERLPTVRRLAEDLSVAPNTIVRVYGELRREGLVESRPGVGTAVTRGVAEVTYELRKEAIFGRLKVLARDAAVLGISEDDLWIGLDSEFKRMPREGKKQ